MPKNREPIEQNIHDTAIANLVRKLQSESPKLEMQTNPGTSKEHPVKTGDRTYYPDLFTYRRGQVKEIFEIETENTVNENSLDQWRLYSSGNAKFYLVVPKASEEKAKALVREHNIDVAGYWTY